MARLRSLRHPFVAAAILTALAVATLAVAAWFLADTQSKQRRDLRNRYTDRVVVASSLIDSLFRIAFSGQATAAADRYADARVPRGRLDAVVKQGQLRYSLIVDAKGRVVGASTGAPRSVDPALLRSALRTGVGLGAARPGPNGLVETAVAFRTPSGPRVQVNASPLRVFRAFLNGTIKPLPTLEGSRAYVLDQNGRALGAARSGAPVVPPSREMLAATRNAMNATYTRQGQKIFAAAQPIPRTPWKIVLTASEQRLYESVSGFRRWAPWAILIVGALALIAVAVLLWRLLRTNAALDTNRRMLEERAIELERSNTDLEQFAYAASHDLSEPLRTVAGFSQLLGARYSGQLDAEGQEYIGHMRSGVDRMQQLIDDLLLYSRVGRAPLRADDVDLEILMTEVLEWIAPAIVERHARITHDPLPVVRGERGPLAQVLQNLLANAIKFTDADVVPEIHVSAEPDGAGFRISVQDNGIGVSDDDVIFKMFGRLHPSDRYPGTGIGLALVKRIIETHEGRIWVEAAPGGGSIFSFTLPAGRPAPRPRAEEVTA